MGQQEYPYRLDPVDGVIKIVLPKQAYDITIKYLKEKTEYAKFVDFGHKGHEMMLNSLQENITSLVLTTEFNFRKKFMSEHEA